MSQISILCIFMFGISFSAGGQFRVLSIQGAAKTSDSVQVAPGRILQRSARIISASKKIRLQVVDENGNYYFLRSVPKETSSHTQTRVNDLQKVNLPPEASSIQLGARIPEVLQSEGRIIIQQTNHYRFDTLRFPMDHGAFVLRTAIKGKKPFDRLLTTREDTLIIRYRDFLSEDQRFEATTFSLHYRSGTIDSTIVSRIDPYFDLSAEVRSLLSSLINYRAPGAGSSSDSVLLRQGHLQTQLAYGKPAPEDFKKLFESLKFNHNDTVNKRLSLGNGLKFGPTLEREHAKRLPDNARVTGHYTLYQWAPVAGQQAQTNSCTAWACAYAAATIEYRQSNKKTAGTFSPEFVYNRLLSGELCALNGPKLKVESALLYMNQIGNIFKQSLDFDCNQKFSDNDVSAALAYRIKSFTRLFKVETEPLNGNDIESIKAEIYTGRKPIIVSMFLPRNGVRDGLGQFQFTGKSSFDFLVNEKSGIWRPTLQEDEDVENRDIDQMAHAMCLIGFNDSINGGSFEILNSYGLGWGNCGRLWVKYTDFMKYGISAYKINSFAK